MLLEFVLLVVDSYRVILSIEAVNESLNGRLMKMSDVGGGVPGLCAKHLKLRGNKAEGIDDNLALHRLYRINNDSNGTGIQLLKALLGIDVNTGKPAAKTGMGMVPTDNHFGTTGLLEHVKHLCLEDGIDGFDGYASSTLRHGENINDGYGVVIDELTQHESHDFHGDPCSSVFEHFQESKGGNVDGLSGIHDRSIGRGWSLTVSQETLQAIHDENELGRDAMSL